MVDSARLRKPLPPLEVLAEAFSYDPYTGLLTWKVAGRRVKAGDRAGIPNENGHLVVGFGGTKYFVHRIIWKLVYGADPAFIVDHEDRNRANNRLINLRPANKYQNQQNREHPAISASGRKGVYRSPKRTKYKAQIRANGKIIYLGVFSTAEEAHEIVKSARTRLHGEFAHEGNGR